MMSVENYDGGWGVRAWGKNFRNKVGSVRPGMRKTIDLVENLGGDGIETSWKLDGEGEETSVAPPAGAWKHRAACAGVR